MSQGQQRTEDQRCPHVLQVGQRDVRGLPLTRSRSILEEAIDGSEMVLPVRRLEPHGARAWETVERRGLEGCVAKDPASTYRSGHTRSRVKVELRHEGVSLSAVSATWRQISDLSCWLRLAAKQLSPLSDADWSNWPLALASFSTTVDAWLFDRRERGEVLRSDVTRTDASGRPSYGNATLPFGISAELVPTSLNCPAPIRV